MIEHDIRSVWTGLNDINIEGDFEWTDGTVVSYTNWVKNEPDNKNDIHHCVRIRRGAGYRWADMNCSFKYQYVCKIKGKVIHLGTVI